MARPQLDGNAPHNIAMPSSPIVVLTGGGPLPWIVINAVVAKYGFVTVLEEHPEPPNLLFRRRLKRLGAAQVAGQIAFGVCQRLLRIASRRRLVTLMASHQLISDPASAAQVISVGSVNSDACRRELTRLKPSVVLVVGTRMIGRATLACINVPFINYHAGINPKYRGMCGGYWALANGDPEHFGVTVHLVDQGVDTGGILYWEKVIPSTDDNFVTYPFVLAAAARPLVVRAMEDALGNRLAPVVRPLDSRQWYHPTLWGYAWTGLTRGVW